MAPSNLNYKSGSVGSLLSFNLKISSYCWGVMIDNVTLNWISGTNTTTITTNTSTTNSTNTQTNTINTTTSTTDTTTNATTNTIASTNTSILTTVDWLS